MPEFALQAIRTTRIDDGSNSSRTVWDGTSELTFFSDDQDAGYSYSLDPNYDPATDGSIPDVFLGFSNGVSLEIDGIGTDALGLTYDAARLVWSGGTTDILEVEASGGNISYLFAMGGTPLPAINSAADFDTFMGSVIATGPITSGSFAPDVFIPFDTLLDVQQSDDDGSMPPAEPMPGVGTDGDDSFTNSGGDQTFEGGSGIDSLVLTGNQSVYTLRLSADGTTIEDRSGVDGTDVLSSIESLVFGDGTFSLSQFGGLASVSQSDLQSFVELYIAYFNRAPDAVGLSFWGTAFANGTSLTEMATLFIDQDETREAYPETLRTAEFATAVYDNVLGRVPDQVGFDFWVGVLENGSVGRDQFILSVLDGAKADPSSDVTPEFIAQQQADRAYLENKTDIGSYFAVQQGMSNVENASAVMALFDGTQESIGAAIDASDGFLTDAEAVDGGEFLMPIVGVLDDLFV